MGYDIFSQPTGPNIDLDLYGRSAKEGTDVGNALPTPLTSIIQQGIKGYETGQDIAIKQHQINEQPVDDAIKAQQLRQSQQINDINQTKVDAAKLTHDTDLQVAQKVADAQLTQATKANEDLKTQDTIEKTIASGDANAVAGLLKNPAVIGQWQANPKLADASLGQIAGLYPQLKDEATRLQGIAQQQKYDYEYAKLQADTDKAIIKAGDTDAKPFLSHLAELSGVSEGMSNTDMANNFLFLQKNAYKRNADGSINKSLTPDFRDFNESPTKMYENYKKGDDGVFRYTGHDVREPVANAYTPFQRYYRAIGRDVARSAQLSDPEAWAKKGPTQQTPQPAKVELSNQIKESEVTSLPEQAAALGKESAANANQNPNVNNRIYDQAAAAIKALKVPQGMRSSAIGEAQAQMKQKINDMLKQQNFRPTAYYGDIGTPSVSYASGPNALNAQVAPIYPSEQFSRIVGAPVTLTTGDAHILEPEARASINNHPILGTQPPIIKALAFAESNGGKNLNSPTGVKGLLQVTKSTAAIYGLNRDIPEENVLAGKLYLTDLLKRYDGNIPLALAAYNVGPGTVSDAIRHTRSVAWDDIKGYLKDHLSAKKYKEIGGKEGEPDYPSKIISYAAQFMGSNKTADNALTYLLERNGYLTLKE